MRCQRCAFYKPADSSPNVVGECHRFPPLVEPLERGFKGKWPVVAHSEWCGEFKEVPEWVQREMARGGSQ